jgi:hypothetical protein
LEGKFEIVAKSDDGGGLGEQEVLDIVKDTGSDIPKGDLGDKYP